MNAYSDVCALELISAGAGAVHDARVELDLILTRIWCE
jgi:hypothetical protein